MSQPKQGGHFNLVTLLCSAKILLFLAAISFPPLHATVAGSERLEDRRMELRVIGEDRKPIAGLAMELVGSEPFENQQILAGDPINAGGNRIQVRSDKEGRIVLSMPKDLVYFAIFIEAPGYAPYWSEWKSQTGHAPPEQSTIELDNGWTMGGVLVDEEGEPIANAIVQPRIQFKRRSLDQSELHIGTRITSDAQGRWKYGSAPASKSSLTAMVRHASFQPMILSVEREKHEVKSTEEPTAKSVMKRGATVKGRVVDANGSPVAGALIRGRFVGDERSTVSQEDGSYRLEGCTIGSARLVVSARKFATDMKPIELAEKPVDCDFTLQPGGHLRVRVVDKEGKPVPRARIFFQDWRGRFEYWEFNHANQYANQDGVWEWNEAPLDGFKADICGPDGMLSHEPLIPRDEEYVFAVPSRLTIAGKVRDAVSGKPIAAFRVIPGRRGPNRFEHWERRDALDGKDGLYEIQIRPTSDEKFAIRIEADGYRPTDSRDIEGDEGRVNLNVILQPAKSTDLKVLTPDGKSAVGAVVGLGGKGAQFQIEAGALQRGDRVDLHLADSNGRCRVTLPEDRFQIVITHDSGYGIVRSDQDRDLSEIRLVRWGELVGECRRGGSPLPDSYFSVESSDAPEEEWGMLLFFRSLEKTDSSGIFRVSKLMEGNVRITQLALRDSNGKELPKQSTISQPVEIKSNETTKVRVGGSGRPVQGKLKEIKEMIRISVMVETEKNPIPKIPEEISTDPEKTTAWWTNWLTTDEGKAWNSKNDANNQLTMKSKWYNATTDDQGRFQIEDVAPGRYKAQGIADERLGLQSNPFLGDFYFEVPSGESREPIDLGQIELTQPNSTP